MILREVPGADVASWQLRQTWTQLLAPDAWDDTALIQAWDAAVQRYKVCAPAIALLAHALAN